jgi:hypothetical protein
MALIAEWMPTGQATRILGVSPFTLKRYADRDCFLIEGKHFRHGPHSNSPRLWNIPACEEALAYRGRLRRQEAS